MAFKNCRSKVKGYDMFGYQVQLNFNRQGESYKSTMGGFISIIFKAALAVFVYIRYMKMINLNDNSYGMNEMPSNFNNTDP